MINRTVKFFSTALAVLALTACATKASPPATPVPPVVEVKVEAKATPQKPAPFTVNASDGWSLVVTEPLSGDEPMLVAAYENELDENNTLIATVVGIQLKDDQAETFYDKMRQGAHEQEEMKVLKEAMVKLGDVPAYTALVIRVRDEGPSAGQVLAVTNGKVGYLLQCYGPLESARIVVPACSKFLSSFRVAK